MPAWIVPAVMAGISLIQGFAGSETGKRNADAARAWGAYNAAMARRYSNFNADSIEKIAQLNSVLLSSTAETNSKITEALAQYNSTLRVQASEFNARLLEKEAELVWQAEELDQAIFARQAELLQKDTRSRFASSGIDVNNGSPVDFMVDQATQINLESFIIRHNADIQAGKLLDAAALGRWQGEAEAAAMMYEGSMTSLSLTTQASMQISQLNAQAAYDALIERFNGEVRASQILSDAEWKASQYKQDGLMSLLTGLFQGASWGLKSFGSYSTYDSDSASSSSYMEI